MKSLPSHRSTAAWKPLALVSALATLSFPAVAQVETGQKLTPVTVSASRFETTEAPIGATVITAEQIREAGVGNANEAIRKIAGVYGRQSAYGTSDYSLDLRGFGTTSDQNMVVLVDGVRISENEQAVPLMSAIPIDAIERIEIVRGGSSVLYGEGATGGTIQIITKKGMTRATRASLFAEVGSFNSKEVRASLAKGWDNFSIDANLSGIHTDNYRDNNKLRQDNFSGSMQWAFKDGRIGFSVASARQDSGLPGSLTQAQYTQNPRQTFTPLNYASIDSNIYTVFAEKRLGNWELAADLSYRDRVAKTSYSPFNQPLVQGAVTTYDGQATQFSPRARYVAQSGVVRNEFIVGLDFSDASRRVATDGNPLAKKGEQKSQALYLRDELRIGDARIAVGARHEQFDKTFRGGTPYDQKISLNAWDLQGSYQITPMASVFAKVGRSYHVANVDDNGYTQNNVLLKPQTSNDYEVGATLGDANRKLTAKLFRHRLKNEIYYDPLTPPCGFGFCAGANVNLDPTEREGIEIEASTRIAEAFILSGVLQHVSAKFIEGPYAGKEMTLVPKNTATLRLNWVPGNGHSADVGLQWVDKQRYAGDFTNACTSKISGFTTLDARYAVRVDTWEFAIRGANLTDKNYYTQAYGECSTDASIYPEAGRSVRLSVRKNF